MRFLIHPLLRCGALALLFAAGQASASDYGCKVLLWLANPASNGGQRGVAGCAEPIDRLYNDLAHGRPFPTCEEAEGSGNRAVLVNDPFDPCPAPLRPAEVNQHVIQGRMSASGVFKFAPSAVAQPGTSNAKRACVGSPIGDYMDGSNEDGHVVNVYDRVVWQQAQSSRAIDIYLDNAWYQRVRW